MGRDAKRKDTNPQVSFPSMPMYTGLPAFQLVPVGELGRIPSYHADRTDKYPMNSGGARTILDLLRFRMIRDSRGKHLNVSTLTSFPVC